MYYSGLDHIGFTVSSLDRAVEWYTFFLDEPPVLRDIWDFDYVGRMVGYPDVKIACAFWNLSRDVTLELVEYIEPKPGTVEMETNNVGNAHLCLTVNDLDADFERLRGRVAFRHPEPVVIPWGPYKGGKACYVRDPDGISIQLMQLPPGGPTFRE